MSSNQQNFALGQENTHEGFKVNDLLTIINSATEIARTQVEDLKKKGKDAISIGEMFEMQMTMNHLSQLSEMSTSVVSASNQAINSMARNVK